MLTLCFVGTVVPEVGEPLGMRLLDPELAKQLAARGLVEIAHAGREPMRYVKLLDELRRKAQPSRAAVADVPPIAAAAPVKRARGRPRKVRA